MADYIKRESALKAIEDSARPFVKTMANDAYWAYKAVEEVPAEDVVTVVRCKDCRFYTRKDGAFYNGYCNKMEYCLIDNDDGFCSFAERKEDAIISH